MAIAVVNLNSSAADSKMNPSGVPSRLTLFLME